MNKQNISEADNLAKILQAQKGKILEDKLILFFRAFNDCVGYYQDMTYLDGSGRYVLEFKIPHYFTDEEINAINFHLKGRGYSISYPHPGETFIGLTRQLMWSNLGLLDRVLPTNKYPVVRGLQILIINWPLEK